mmetsp:Transcript_999/g.1221  ORF Transcript_999/g.1221 Transcript_999/m.1221 type:complete len:589 (-) Transcript_999:188-1954(-)
MPLSSSSSSSLSPPVTEDESEFIRIRPESSTLQYGRVGYFTQDQVNGLGTEWNLSFENKGILQSIWANHPNRQQAAVQPESSKRLKISCKECTESFKTPSECDKHMLMAHATDVDPPEIPIAEITDYFISSKHLKVAGLSTADSNILFMREEACQLLKKLQEDEDHSFLIQGPPGSGKSSVVWLWACLMATTSDIMWVHLDPIGLSSCVRLYNGKFYSFTKHDNLLNDMIATCNCHTIILDGITKDNIKLIGTALSGIRRLDNIGGPFVVAVASTQLVMALEHLQQQNIKVLSMDSWTLEQYNNCCSNEDFYDEVKTKLGEGEEKDERIINKYYYAGGCARWMFSFTVNETCIDVENHINKCENFVQLIEESSGPSSNVAVNHLRQKRGNAHFIISKHVMREIVKKCDKTFIKGLTAVSSIYGNPSFDGWVFEMDFLIQINEMCKDVTGHTSLQVLNADKSVAGTLYGHDYRTFIDARKLREVRFKEYTWLVPKKWNQGGYDAVQVINSDTIRFVQVTRGETHSLKLQYMQRFLNDSQLEMNHVEVVFVVPIMTEFNLPTQSSVSGRLNNWNLKDLKVFYIERSFSCV